MPQTWTETWRVIEEGWSSGSWICAWQVLQKKISFWFQALQGRLCSIPLLDSDRLRDGYEILLLGDAKLSAREKISESLWQNCFYNFIQATRKVHTFSLIWASPFLLRSPNWWMWQSKEGQAVGDFRRLLEEGSGFYHNLLRHLKDTFDHTAISLGNLNDLLWNLHAKSLMDCFLLLLLPSDSMEPERQICHDSLGYLGDLGKSSHSLSGTFVVGGVPTALLTYWFFCFMFVATRSQVQGNFFFLNSKLEHSPRVLQAITFLGPTWRWHFLLFFPIISLLTHDCIIPQVSHKASSAWLPRSKRRTSTSFITTAWACRQGAHLPLHERT